ncbi:MAG TPA: MFS transporter [Beijerinckiaceae bacterium]|nr:MFS transporter [Beijerinckiaceae bacterium]
MTCTGAPPGPGEAKISGYTAFRHRDFRLHCAARLLFGVALSMQSVAIGWYVYSVTNSALALGFSGLASFLPSLLLTPFTGHVADTHSRKRIVGLSFLVCAAASLGLFCIAYLHLRDVLPIYACIVVAGSAKAFANPAAQALTPNLVPKDQFANAITWYSSAWSAANISGPAIGGFLYVLGPTTAFAAAILAFASAATSSLLIRHAPRTGLVRERISWATISAGLRFIYSRQVIFGAISLDLVAVLFGGATALLPIIAKHALHTGPWGLGLLRASPAIGAIAMGAALAHAPITFGAGKKMLGAVGVYGAAIAAFAFSSSLALSMALLALAGAADQVSVVVRHTMVQTETPDDMRGRVAAVNSIFIGASSDLGEFESGATAALLGAIPAIAFGGAMTIVLALAWSVLFPRLRKRDRLIER